MLKLTALAYDGPIWINTKLVTSLEAHEGGTVIYFDQDNYVKVRETVDEVGKLWPAIGE